MTNANAANWVLGKRVFHWGLALAVLIALLAPKPERDALIAATALTLGLTVMTRNVGDFETMGVCLLNPWLAPSA